MLSLSETEALQLGRANRIYTYEIRFGFRWVAGSCTYCAFFLPAQPGLGPRLNARDGESSETPAGSRGKRGWPINIGRSKGGVDREAGCASYHRDLYWYSNRASLSWRAGDLFAGADDRESDSNA